MRTYIFTARGLWRGSDPVYDLFPGKVVTSDLRLRAVLVIMARRWFGPRFRRGHKQDWAEDGFMGMAFDRHGNSITIEQVHDAERHDAALARKRMREWKGTLALTVCNSQMKEAA